MLTDPVADMLTRIRNANKALQDRVVMPTSQAEGRDRPPAQGGGLHQGLPASRRGESFDNLVVELKYGRSRERVITDLKRVSKPGRRVYARKDRLPRVLGGMGTAILSTSHGSRHRAAPPQRAGRRRRGHLLRLVAELRRMSRIGRQPIPVPAGVNIAIDPGRVMVNGPLGELTQQRAGAHDDRAARRTSSSSRARPSAARTARCTA